MYTRFALCIVLFLSLGGCFHPSKSSSGGGSNSGDDGGGGNDGGNTTITCPKDCPWESYTEVDHSDFRMHIAVDLVYQNSSGQVQISGDELDTDTHWGGDSVLNLLFPEGTFLQMAAYSKGSHNMSVMFSNSLDLKEGAPVYLHTYLNGQFIETGTTRLTPAINDGKHIFVYLPDPTTAPLAYRAMSNLKENDSFYFIFDMEETDGGRVKYTTPNFNIKKGKPSSS